MRVLFSLLLVLLLAGCATGMNAGKTEAQVRQRAKLHSELAAGYYAQNKMAIALEEFSLSAKIDPDYAVAFNGLGLVHASLGEDAKAEENFKRSLELDPGSSEARNNYGTFLCSRNRIDESITQFMAAVKNPLYSTPELAYLNAGVCALKKPDEKSAEQYLMRAQQIRPEMRQAAFNLAKINFGRKDYAAAWAQLQTATASGDPGPEAAWLGVQIARELGDRNGEASFSMLLRNKYPKSEQAKALLSGQ